MSLSPSIKHPIAALIWAAAIGLAGCAVEPVPINTDATKPVYYTRYTLRGTQSGFNQLIYRSNYLSQPVVAGPGVKVAVSMYSDVRIDMMVNGIPSQMHYRDQPFPKDKEGIDAFFAKHFVKSPDELKLNLLQENVRRQINEGVAALGMTKNEVLLALGYPSQIDNYVSADGLSRERIVDSNQWIYRNHEIMLGWAIYWIYQFNPDDGKLTNVIR